MQSPPPSLSEPPAEQTCPAPRAGARGCPPPWADPEWLVFLGVLTTPALLAWARGDGLRASFFLGAAAYVAVLKWLGWLLFTRKSLAKLAFVRFPAELFAGLAVVCAWFYLRNLVARFWPASYGLRELSMLFPGLLAVHVVAAAWTARSWLARGARALACDLLERLAVHAPFTVALAVALGTVSGTLGVPGVDAMHHAFTARVYREEGMAFAVPPLGVPIVYPSGFGAMNAVTAALAPLDVVQAVYLQHVLWCVVAVFLVTCTVATVAGRPLVLLHGLALPFLSVFPLYALYPDIFYPGTPKQVGPPLFAALALLPLLTPMTGRISFALAIAAWALLAPLSVALNPACASYATAGFVLGLAVHVRRAKAARLLPRLGSAALQVGLVVAAAALVLGSDPFLVSVAKHFGAPPPAPSVATPPAASAPPPAPSVATPPAASAPPFSLKAALAGLRVANPVGLSPPVSATTTSGYDNLEGWNDRPLPRSFVLLMFGLTPAALALNLLARRRGAVPPCPLLGRLLLTALALWFAVKYAGSFLGSGLSTHNPDTYYLSGYTRYLLPRCELLLMLACLAGSATSLYLAARQAGALRGARAAVLLGAAGLLCWLLPAAWLLGGRQFSGTTVLPASARFSVTEDDLRLVAWIDDNLPPEKGQIGLAALATRGGPDKRERHLHPLDAGHALAVRGRHYNVRFALPALEGAAGFADYGARVRDEFDAAWCLANGLRYFYAGPNGLKENPGLARAVADGRLRPVHEGGSGVIYEVTTGGGK